MNMRLLIDEPLDGATNMARDAALLALLTRGAAPPTLRLYRWASPCLSLGRFQRVAAIDRAACAATGTQVVRRPSGGWALLHDDELTYALVLPTDSALGNGTIMKSYQQISAGLCEALRRLGAAAELMPPGKRRPTTDERRPTAACYDAPAAFELAVAGRKLVGSAQKRVGGALLQHGAIPFAPHAERLCALLHRPPHDLAQRMITLDEAIGRRTSYDEVAEALVAGCATAWGVAFTHGVWAAEELALAEELRTTTYADERWTWGVA